MHAIIARPQNQRAQGVDDHVCGYRRDFGFFAGPYKKDSEPGAGRTRFGRNPDLECDGEKQNGERCSDSIDDSSSPAMV